MPTLLIECTLVQKPCVTKTSSRRLTPSATSSSVADPAGSGAGASNCVACHANLGSHQLAELTEAGLSLAMT